MLHLWSIASTLGYADHFHDLLFTMIGLDSQKNNVEAILLPVSIYNFHVRFPYDIGLFWISEPSRSTAEKLSPEIPQLKLFATLDLLSLS